MKKAGLYLLLGGIALEVGDRFLSPPATALSSNETLAGLQQNLVALNETLIPVPQVHLSYLLIAVGAFLYWK